MDRRKALKNMGLSLGYVVATPTVISLLQSCKNDTKELTSWTPEFYSNDEGVVLKNLIDLILPKTDNLPGAIDLNIHKFIDVYSAKVYNKKAQKDMKSGTESILIALGITEKKLVSTLKTADYDAFLAKYLRATKEEQDAFSEKDKVVFNTLKEFRDKTVWAYKTTEEIGENVLAYDPVPGVQLGCISLEEATGGKAWSL